MKRLLILFAIIYCINCTSLCNSVTSPKNVSVCLEKDVSNENNTCCFFKSPPGNEDITSCYEIPKNEGERDEYIRRNYPAIRSYNYTCAENNQNYYKFFGTSLLLFGALILL